MMMYTLPWSMGDMVQIISGKEANDTYIFKTASVHYKHWSIR